MKAEDDIYTIVSDHEQSSTCQDSQPPCPMPYETAIFHDRHQSVDVLKLDTKSALKQCGRKEEDLQHGENHKGTNRIIDEQHVYDEVNHEAKINEGLMNSESFDDVVYSSQCTQSDNVKAHQVDSGEGNVLSQNSIKFTKKDAKREHKSAENNQIYDSADQAIQMKMGRVTPSVSLHIYHALESPHDTTVAHPLSNSTNDQSVDCNKCQFDDPMYESNIQPLASPTPPNSTKAVDTSAQENGSTTLDNPDIMFTNIYQGDPESVSDAPRHNDPSNLVPTDNHDGQDGNVAKIYGMFDDPIYGACHHVAGSNID